MKRRDAIKKILEEYDDGNTLFISTDGMISRELYDLKKKGVFPMVGSFGLASAIGFGLALNTKKKVVILDGDGAFLFSKGTQNLIEWYGPPNLTHIVLDNRGYGTTGGQIRVEFIPGEFDNFKYLRFIGMVDGEEKPPRIENLKQIKEVFMDEVQCNKPI